jgi:DNA-binding response OmpR family regulator
LGEVHVRLDKSGDHRTPLCLDDKRHAFAGDLPYGRNFTPTHEHVGPKDAIVLVARDYRAASDENIHARSRFAPTRTRGEVLWSSPESRMVARVLVVDDSATIRKVVSGVLQRHGFEVLQAPDGQSALEALTAAAKPENGNGASGIDLVLVDFVMPRMNGFQLCRALRQSEHLRATPVVLMSAKSDRIATTFVQQTGAIDAIAKPFDAQALVAVIENAMRRSDQWRARGATAAASIPEEFQAPEGQARRQIDAASGPSALAGDLAAIPIGAAMQLLQLECKSGAMLVTDGATEVTITLRDGLIDLVQARGAGREFRLGRYFVEHGLVTEADIDRLLRESQPPGFDEERSARKLLGDLLVHSGRVTREQLRDALARQSSELVYEVLRWPKGRFEFRCDPPPPLAESARLGLPVASVVMEGFRRVDEWRLIESGVGSFDSILLTDEAAVEAIDIDRLAVAEQRLLEMVDGERSVREIIEESHMSSFDACKILFQLLEARLVRRRAA